MRACQRVPDDDTNIDAIDVGSNLSTCLRTSTICIRCLKEIVNQAVQETDVVPINGMLKISAAGCAKIDVIVFINFIEITNYFLWIEVLYLCQKVSIFVFELHAFEANDSTVYIAGYIRL